MSNLANKATKAKKTPKLNPFPKYWKFFIWSTLGILGHDWQHPTKMLLLYTKSSKMVKSFIWSIYGQKNCPGQILPQNFSNLYVWNLLGVFMIKHHNIKQLFNKNPTFALNSLKYWQTNRPATILTEISVIILRYTYMRNCTKDVS